MLPESARREATLTIRRLIYADLPHVIAIERRSFPTPWSLAMFVLELSKPSGICLAALDGDRLVAYCVCSRYDTVWHLMNIAVDPERRREGIAAALLARLFDEADKPGEQYTLEVRPSNLAARHLYRKLGFQQIAIRPEYYPAVSGREDALFLGLTL